MPPSRRGHKTHASMMMTPQSIPLYPSTNQFFGYNAPLYSSPQLPVTSGYYSGPPRHASPMDYINRYLATPSGELWAGEINQQTGQAQWVPARKTEEANTVTEFKLPGRRVENFYDGNQYRPFVGWTAFLRPIESLCAYWTGGALYSVETNELIDAPLSFTHCFLNTFGLVGHLYIPQEKGVDDLLISKSERASKDIMYPVSTKFKADAKGVKMLHPQSGRPMAGLTPKQVWETAWTYAVFKVEDCYTLPGKDYDERMMHLGAFFNHVGADCKQLSLISVSKLYSESFIQDTHESMPDDSMLVMVPPNEPYENSTSDRIRRPARHYSDDPAQSIQGRVFAHQIDPSGAFSGVYVEGDNGDVGVVGEGQLWVSKKSSIKSLKQYNQKLSDEIKKIRKIRLPYNEKQAAIRAYQQDAADQVMDEDSYKLHSTAGRDLFVRNFTLNKGGVNAGIYNIDDVGLTTDQGKARKEVLDLLDPSSNLMLGFDIASSTVPDDSVNLMAWQSNVDRNTWPVNTTLPYAYT
ncbi:hypothetical protein JKP88DRAFT_241059 [Tribonema minus]|uniref:Uncharacterized protein n=1 Tax=Tribonema minus TaxID=303371 RepID=A0A835Z3Q1_9STRA|nr:hypothetical protein JKP88DRAFT_241059 [Tribonema minus]